MKLRLSLFFLVALLAPSYAQDALWTKTDGRPIAAEVVLDRASSPSQFIVYTLDLEALKQRLLAAPQRGVAQPGIIVPFPDGGGTIKNFRVYVAPVLHPQLAAKHPDIKSYAGYGIDDPSETIRFSITPFGLHTMIFSVSGTSYTDPYTNDYTNYIAYRKESLTTARSFHCGVTGSHSAQRMDGSGTPVPPPSSDGFLRTYRLAMACTAEYTAFHVNAAGLNAGTVPQKKAAVLAAMNVSMTRINGIFERDLSLTMQLVPNNEDVIFIDSDNFNNDDAGVLIEQSQIVIDNIIGFDNYDIGHTVSTGGGGLAQLWSPCSEGKAKGITGLPSPVGDPFDVDYVAHEMGHQYGGNHSFNNSCAGNRSDENAYEPGSGSTIMAYAGICGPNVQNNSDAHFHAGSIAEMTAFITGWGNCSQNTVTGNIAPIVDAGQDYTIPRGTPFMLTGTATDANGDAMTYNWEQMDNEISVQPPSPNSDEGPNFRSLPPKPVPVRYMPDLNSVLANNLTPTWEVVANVARHYDFAFTVRDNNITGGQVVIDDMRVNVSGTAGPFLVTSPNTNISWQAGTNQTVTWDVAGTTENGIDTPYIDVFLSNDGGQTYPVVLAAKVPNDGSETVTVPNLPGTANRIMVKGRDNIFYDLSNTNFTIAAPANTMSIAVSGDQNITGCVGVPVSYTLSYAAYGGFAGNTTFSVTGNPPGSTVTFSPASTSANGTVLVTVSGTDTAAAGFYSMTVTATSGAVTKTVNIYLDLLDTNFGTVALAAPANNSVNISQAVQFEWNNVANASGYVIEIATDEDFENIIIAEAVSANSYSTTMGAATMYYWRVSPSNPGCTGNPGQVFTFTTGITNCENYASANVPVVIPANSTGTVTSQVTVTGNMPLDIITVGMNISHTWLEDLIVTLTSPQGTVVELFNQVCEDMDNVNATFSDAGALLECSGTPAVSGLVMPSQPLSAFSGEAAEGVWTLSVSDVFNQDGGALNNWSLNICGTEDAPVAGVTDVAFAGFSLYPNPSSGDFTVTFNSVSGNDIMMGVYDMRGRQVFRRSYANTGMFEQNVALGGAEAGIYLVQLQDGESRITKKIIIK